MKDELFVEWSISDIYLDSGDNDIFIKGICIKNPKVPALTMIKTIIKTISHPELSLFSADVDLVICYPSGVRKQVTRKKVQFGRLFQKG